MLSKIIETNKVAAYHHVINKAARLAALFIIININTSVTSKVDPGNCPCQFWMSLFKNVKWSIKC